MMTMTMKNMVMKTRAEEKLHQSHLVTQSGFVHDPQDNVDENNQYYILRGHVHHSMKNLLTLNTEVCVSIMSGFIKSARCDCKAGLVGRCSHVAAVLLMLSNYILENGHVVEKTSTSLPCS